MVIAMGQLVVVKIAMEELVIILQTVAVGIAEETQHFAILDIALDMAEHNQLEREVPLV
jgi:hypothetical protein